MLTTEQLRELSARIRASLRLQLAAKVYAVELADHTRHLTANGARDPAIECFIFDLAANIAQGLA